MSTEELRRLHSEMRQRTELVGLRLTPDEHSAAESRAAEAGVTVQELIRHLLAAPTSPSVPGSTERPEGLSAEILDLRGHEITKRHDGTVIRYVLTGVTIPPGTIIGGFDFDPETGAVGWSQVNAGKPPVANVAAVWAGPGCCRAAYESDGHAHDHPSGPRVFAMPEIPEDVSAVRDTTGNEWARDDGVRWHCRTDEGAYYRPLTTFQLLHGRGPLTEVVEP